MRKFITALGIVTVLLSLNACLVSKKVVYVKDMQVDVPYDVATAPPLRIQKNDRLSIQVTAKNPELAVPFNVSGGVYSVTEKGNVDALRSEVNTERGYLVDQQGLITFPVLGTLKVEGLSLEALKNLIREQLIDRKLISDPVINVELLNLKVMMMGEVSGKGIISAPDGRLTLLEAITRSGGLTNNAMEDEVMVIREENGVRKMYANNIEKTDIFNSPTYYLQQNDIVYVKPKSAETTPREQMTWRYIGLTTGLVSLIVSFWALLK